MHVLYKLLLFVCLITWYPRLLPYFKQTGRDRVTTARPCCWSADFTNLVNQMHLQDLAEADAAKEQIQQVQVQAYMQLSVCAFYVLGFVRLLTSAMRTTIQWVELQQLTWQTQPCDVYEQLLQRQVV